MALTWVKIANLRGPAGPIHEWVRRDLLLNEDLDTLTVPGLYRIRSFAIAGSLKNTPRTPNTGTVEVIPSSDNGIHQRYIFGNGFNQPRMLERAGTVTAGVGSFGPWVPMTQIAEPLLAGDDISTFTTPGRYTAPNATVATAVTGIPSEVANQPGILDVTSVFTTATAYRANYRWTTLPYAVGRPPRTFERSATQAGEMHGWLERPYVTPAVSTPISGNATAINRRAMLMQASKLRHGGVIGLGDRTAVALSFDHGFANYRDHLLPHLIRLGLPHSVAVNPGTLGTGESAGVGFPELQAWALTHGVELTNHAASHSDAVTAADMEKAILGALATIRAGAPKTTVDAFIMPGVSGTKYDGFGSGENPESWWSHPAGQLILDNHAVVTAALLGQAVPMSGAPVQTVDRMGLDLASWVSIAQDHIRSLQGSGMGVHVFNHPSAIGDTVTAARLVEFLEFLAAERNAGRVEVLTVSGFAWASADTSRRYDLSRGAWVGNSAAVALAPLQEWARGGQWQLSVVSSAAASVTLKATDGGLLNSTITVPVAAGGVARLNFGIPVDADTLTFSASTTAGTLTAHRVTAI